MKNTKLPIILSLAGLTAMAGTSQAVTVITSLLPPENVVGGVNEGGLTSGALYSNGNDALKFKVEFSDSGVDFDTILTVTLSAGSITTTNASGNTAFRLANGNNGTVAFTVGAVNSSSPGTHTASFDGFSAMTFANGGDGDFDGTIYSFAGGGATTAVGLEGSGSVLADAPGGGLMDFTGIESSFTVTPVPEPGSLALIGMACLGMVARRKRSS